MNEFMSNPTVAVVEDDEFLRNLLVSSLANAGYSVWGASSAEQFFRQAAIAHFDIAIVDVLLPGEDGLSLIKHISQSATVGIICITGDTSIATEAKAWEAGVHMFFHKPVVIEKLLMAIRVIWSKLAGASSKSFDEQRCWVLNDIESAIYDPDGAAVSLSQGELAFLKILAERPMEVVPNSEILLAMFGEDPDAEHKLAMLLSRLRRKFKSRNIAPPLRSIFGKGRVFAGRVICARPTPASIELRTAGDRKAGSRPDLTYGRTWKA